MVTFENIEIVDAASDGTAVAKVNDMVVFIPYGAPGDIVDIQIVKKKKSFKSSIFLRYPFGIPSARSR